MAVELKSELMVRKTPIFSIKICLKRVKLSPFNILMVIFVYFFNSKQTNKKNKILKKCIIDATVKNDLSSLKVLLSKDPYQLGLTNEDNETLLHIAVRCNAMTVAEYLARIFPQALKMPDKDKDLPLHVAMWRKRDSLAFQFMQAAPETIDTTGKNGMTALRIANLNDKKSLSIFVRCIQTKFDFLDQTIKASKSETLKHLILLFTEHGFLLTKDTQTELRKILIKHILQTRLSEEMKQLLLQLRELTFGTLFSRSLFFISGNITCYRERILSLPKDLQEKMSFIANF